MTVQLSVAVRNARLDAIETTIGASAKLKVSLLAKMASKAKAAPLPLKAAPQDDEDELMMILAMAA